MPVKDDDGIAAPPARAQGFSAYLFATSRYAFKITTLISTGTFSHLCRKLRTSASV